MLTTVMATQIINEHLVKGKNALVDLMDGLNQKNFSSIKSDRAYPPFNRVMMDGIAISQDAYQAGIKEFVIEGTVAAGSPQQKLNHFHHCLEVMTGAVLPLHCDIVIPYENIEIVNQKAKLMEDYPYERGQNIHQVGSDLNADEMVLNEKACLNPPHIGIAASFGVEKIQVEKKPKVAIISTGDELVDIEQTPAPHQIRRSNVYALAAAMKSFGFNEIELFHLPDEKHTIAEHYQSQRIHFDWMIYSGGVSKGKYDYLPEVWSEAGVECFIHGVRQRPGKPLWFGTDQATTTNVIGLPGNPISSLVCLYRYFLQVHPLKVKLAKAVNFHLDLTYFLPVKIIVDDNATLWAHPQEPKNSGEFIALAYTDGFVELPKDKNVFLAGECFDFYGWKSS